MTSGNQPNKQEESEHTNKKADTNSHAVNNLSAQTHINTTKPKIPPSPHTYEITCKTEKDWRDRFKFWAEMVGLAVLIAYTTFAALQWCEMRKTNKLSGDALSNAKTQFQQDQRPYMWPAKFIPFPVKVKEPIRVNSYYVNYGKTPALRQKSIGKILVFSGEGTLAQADRFFATFDESKIVGGSEIIVPPGIPPDPKQSQAFATDRSDVAPVDAKAVNEINKTDGSYAVVGVITYYDAFGNHYRSDYCAMHLANGNVAWCARHNEIH